MGYRCLCKASATIASTPEGRNTGLHATTGESEAARNQATQPALSNLGRHTAKVNSINPRGLQYDGQDIEVIIARHQGNDRPRSRRIASSHAPTVTDLGREAKCRLPMRKLTAFGCMSFCLLLYNITDQGYAPRTASIPCARPSMHASCKALPSFQACPYNF